MKGSIVIISYTGKDLAADKIFDTTKEEEAKKEGIFQEEGYYKPFPVIIGKGEIIKGLEEAVEQMKEGEERIVKIPPEKAFGERKAEFVKLMPMQEFKSRNINPRPGLMIELNELRGRVQSVSGGRVRVDFNHEMAGREIEYKVKVEKILKEPKEKIQALFEKYFPFIKEPKLEIKEKTIEAIIPSKEALKAAPMKEIFVRIIGENLEGIEKVRFVEEFATQEEKKKKIEGIEAIANAAVDKAIKETAEKYKKNKENEKETKKKK